MATWPCCAILALAHTFTSRWKRPALTRFTRPSNGGKCERACHFLNPRRDFESVALSLARFCFLTVILAASSVPGASSAGDSPQQTDADAALAAYFNRETGLLSAACSATTHTTLPDWEARRPELRREAAEMLGLDPLPPRTE